jgi:hypothetical protein
MSGEANSAWVLVETLREVCASRPPYGVFLLCSLDPATSYRAPVDMGNADDADDVELAMEQGQGVPGAFVAVLDGHIQTSKAGKHGHVKAMISLRQLGTTTRFDVVIASNRRVLRVIPRVWPADVLEVVMDREIFVVMPTAADASGDLVEVHAMRDIVDTANRRSQQTSDVPSVEVLEFTVGRWFRYRIALKIVASVEISNALSPSASTATDASAQFGGRIPRS